MYPSARVVIRWAARLLAGSTIVLSASSFAGNGTSNATLSVGATVVDRCEVGNAAAAPVSWACSTGTEARIALGLRSETSGAYRLLSSLTASASAGQVDGVDAQSLRAEPADGTRLVVLYTP